MKQDFIEAGAIYHIYNRGNNKENIFFEEKNYGYFLQLFSKYILPIADVYSYCLLKNHFHFLLRIKDYEELEKNKKTNPSQQFSNLFNSYTKSVNKMYERSGSLFQEHLKRKRVDNEKYLIQLISYIHLNPIKHKLTSDFKNYRFSSYRAYTSSKETKIDREFVFNFIDKKEFEYWHDDERVALEEVQRLLKGME